MDPKFCGLVAAALLAPISVLAQISAYPPQLRFTGFADAAMSIDDVPMQRVNVQPFAVGLPFRPYRLRAVIPLAGPNDPTGAINFLTISPSASSTPMTVNVALNSKVVPWMRPGVYTVVVKFEYGDEPSTPEGGLNTPGLFVTLVLYHPGRPVIESVVNSASMVPGVSPGQLVTIRGVRLSTPPLTGDADTGGLFPMVLGNTRVKFNGIAAPLLYVSNTQINCVAPLSLAGKQAAEVVVERVAGEGSTDPSLPLTIAVNDTSPGIFTLDSSGSGAATVLNTSAAGVPNDENHPAPKGTRIDFFATGSGLWNVSFPDGELVLSPALTNPRLPQWVAPVAPVSVTIGGKPATLVRATAQPKNVLGMLQVTVQVPEEIASGAQPLVLRIGDRDNSDQRTTVWVE